MEEKSNGKQCKVVKNKNFTTMSNIHLWSKSLTLKAKGLMSLCLSLPDDWDYSIAGLVMLSHDGRDAVANALNELKKYYFLSVDKMRTKNGKFLSFYTFYENPKENPNYSDSPESETVEQCTFHRDGFSDTANPIRENRIGFTDTVNPQQLNTNNKITKTNLFLIEKEIFTNKDLFNLYKSICIHFPQPSQLTQKRTKKINLRLKEHPEKEFWETAFKKAEKSVFIRKSKFYSLDWIIQNDTNCVKVFEGCYNGEEIKDDAPASGSKDKYSKCYG